MSSVCLPAHAVQKRINGEKNLKHVCSNDVHLTVSILNTWAFCSAQYVELLWCVLCSVCSANIVGQWGPSYWLYFTGQELRMTHIHPAAHLKVFSTPLHNEIAQSLWSPVTLSWALCHKLYTYNPGNSGVQWLLQICKQKWRTKHTFQLKKKYP